MLELYQLPQPKELPSYSPFCLKVESYLIFHGIAYKSIPVISYNNIVTNYLPYIKHENKIITDSNSIIRYLDKYFQINMDFTLNTKQKGISHAIETLCQESLYYYILYARLVEKSNFALFSQYYLANTKRHLKLIKLLRLKYLVYQLFNTKTLFRCSKKRIYSRAKKDLINLSQILGNGHYIHGTNMTSVDFTVFANLANIYYPPFLSPIKKELLRLENLVNYCQRIRERISLKLD